MTIKVGQRYTHYKRGGKYEIMHLGVLQSNTVDDKKQVVIYKQLHDHPDYPAGTLWVRTVEMFMETVKFDSKKVHRFQLIN